MHVMPPYAGSKGTFPVAEELSRIGLSLPTHGLLTEEDVDYVCDRLLHHAGNVS
jgi:perosamine synthetase